jgi:N-acetyl-alpha-D-muramate 1-phosphate uridylyltransferase
MENMEKYAMIFAAGKGTRLGNITAHRPKALVEITGKPLLYHVIKKLHHAGFQNIVVNIHHHADLVRNFLKQTKFPNLNIMISDESGELLETGGGLKFARHFFDQAEHILLHNVDIISDINLSSLWNAHLGSENLATLAVRNRQTSRYFLFNEALFLKGWMNTLNGEKKIFDDNAIMPLAFSGIHVVTKTIFENMPDNAVFSMTDLYLDLCTRFPVQAWLHDIDMWADVGKPEHFSIAEEIIQKMNKNP